MHWKQKLAQEWLKFIGIALVSFPLGLGVSLQLDDEDTLWPAFLVFVIFIYAVRLTVWSIKQRKH